MNIATDFDFQTERELLRLALANSARSVLMLVVGVGYLVVLGVQAGALGATVVVGVVGWLNAAVRWVTARRLLAKQDMTPPELAAAVRGLEIHAAVAGLVWVVASVGIYPHLSPSSAVAYAVMLVGSNAVAATFLSLAGRAYLILSGMQLGGLAVVTAWGAALGSWSVAVLGVLFGLTMHHAAQSFRAATARGIRHRREVDAANDALKQALQTAQSAGLAKSQFLATMSHEIRTPMNGVLGALDLLQQTPLQPEQRRLVRTAALSGETLLGLLNDVLDHSRIDAGRLELRSEPMSVTAAAVAAADLCRGSAQSKGLALQVELAPGLPERVLGDSQRLRQVLLNLLGNAVKFTERGSVTLALRPVRARSASRLAVVFEVRDTGRGIPAGQLDSIFEPFHQVMLASGQPRRGGTGLGLSISQRIVNAMGGHISVDSRPGQGSFFAFVLEFEADPAPQLPLPQDTVPAPLNDLPSTQATVLVAEDNPVNRMIAGEMLRNLGMLSVLVEDGQEAVDRVRQGGIDLVLMDVQMPVLDGHAATQRIREHEALTGLRRLPIVAVTAHSHSSDAALHDVGLDAHLAKPFSQAELQAVIQRMIQAG